MTKIKTGIIGTGFIGPAHVEALRRLGFVDVAAVAERSSQHVGILSRHQWDGRRAFGDNYHEAALFCVYFAEPYVVDRGTDR